MDDQLRYAAEVKLVLKPNGGLMRPPFGGECVFETKKNKEFSMTDAEKVDAYMGKLVHPLKAEIEAVRLIIKNVNSKISERIKWNAPSYYYKEDLVTFNHRAQQHVHLVFHNPVIVKIQSPLLEGDYDTRRMVYLKDMKAVKANKKELERILSELVKRMDKV